MTAAALVDLKMHKHPAQPQTMSVASAELQCKSSPPLAQHRWQEEEKDRVSLHNPQLGASFLKLQVACICFIDGINIGAHIPECPMQEIPRGIHCNN